ncbi:NAD-dependent succinate-semialdehyde dehydrogenase [Alcaligenaceae bacterium]|nr:NAD-dependent succinate-semialdehyde dehydrogenase [Alcaligenaceae bacterium]
MSQHVNYPKLEMLIDGQWLDCTGRDSEPVINPATGETIAQLPHATQADLDRAVKSASAALPLWRARALAERVGILKRAGQLIQERSGEIARWLTMDTGKPLKEATGEVMAAGTTLEWYAEESRRLYGRTIPGKNPEHILSVLLQPVGVCAAFSPWNFPATLSARKIAGAIAAGCSLVIKPAEETPSAAIAVARALMDAGLPAGVLNVVFGAPAEISDYLLSRDEIRKFSFTGSTAVGKILAEKAARGLKKATLELGGHAPTIICEDADLESVVEALVQAKCRTAGQVCIAPTRVMVAEPLYEKFIAAIVPRMERVRVGDGLNPESEMGPLIGPRRANIMKELVEDAQSKGARVLCGGKAPDAQKRGYFWMPTVLADVPHEARVMNEEPFGPIMLVQKYKTLDDAISEANRLPYGLAAYVFTQNSITRRRVVNEIESGAIGINSFYVSMNEAPFGGIKESGYGVEMGSEGLREYLNIKLVSEDFLGLR